MKTVREDISELKTDVRWLKRITTGTFTLLLVDFLSILLHLK